MRIIGGHNTDYRQVNAINGSIRGTSIRETQVFGDIFGGHLTYLSGIRGTPYLSLGN